MIITEQKTIEQLIDSLQGATRVFLVGCGECATTCKTGGREELDAMQSQLARHGVTVTGSCVPKAPCVASQIKIELAKNGAALRGAQAILAFSCGLGVQSVKDNNRLGQAVLPGCNSLCGAVVDAQGNFMEKCSLCGQCVLETTAGVCPVTLCAKGLLNGPCGGMNKGKCEVDKEQDCAWVLIYEASRKQDTLGRIRMIQPPKDHKKSQKPHKILLTKG